MRTTHSLLAFLVTVLSVAPLALTHCSGNSASKVTSGGNGSSGGHTSSGGGNGSSGGTSSGGNSSGGEDDAEVDGASSGVQGGSSSGGDGGGVTGDGAPGSSSGATAVPVPDGGAPSDPMMVTCGSTTCDTNSQQCCVAADGGGGTCTAFTAGCTSGITEPCDEAADCTNAVCCQPLECGAHSTSCKTACAAGDFQLCRTDSECGATSDAGAAKQCIVQMCPTQATYPAGCGGTMVKVEACAYPTAGAFGAVTWGPLTGCTAE
jgi:hypothetical protein